MDGNWILITTLKIQFRSVRKSFLEARSKRILASKRELLSNERELWKGTGEEVECVYIVTVVVTIYADLTANTGVIPNG